MFLIFVYLIHLRQCCYLAPMEIFLADEDHELAYNLSPWEFVIFRQCLLLLWSITFERFGLASIVMGFLWASVYCVPSGLYVNTRPLLLLRLTMESLPIPTTKCLIT